MKAMKAVFLILVLSTILSTSANAKSNEPYQIHETEIQQYLDNGEEVVVVSKEPIRWSTTTSILEPDLRSKLYTTVWGTPVYKKSITIEKQYNPVNEPKGLNAGATYQMAKILCNLDSFKDIESTTYNKTNEIVLQDVHLYNFQDTNDSMELLTDYSDEYYIDKNSTWEIYDNPNMMYRDNVYQVEEYHDDYLKVSRFKGSESNERVGYIANNDTEEYYVVYKNRKSYNTEQERDRDRYDKTEQSIYNEDRNSIVNAAISHIGQRYTYGGNTWEGGVDCSAFVQLLYDEVLNIEIGNNTYQQLTDDTGQFISIRNIQPGDLVYYTKDGQTPYHVAMYAGNGECIEAKDERMGICRYPVKWSGILAIRSYIK